MHLVFDEQLRDIELPSRDGWKNVKRRSVFLSREEV